MPHRTVVYCDFEPASYNLPIWLATETDKSTTNGSEYFGVSMLTEKRVRNTIGLTCCPNPIALVRKCSLHHYYPPIIHSRARAYTFWAISSRWHALFQKFTRERTLEIAKLCCASVQFGGINCLAFHYTLCAFCECRCVCDLRPQSSHMYGWCRNSSWTSRHKEKYVLFPKAQLLHHTPFSHTAKYVLRWSCSQLCHQGMEDRIETYTFGNVHVVGVRMLLLRRFKMSKERVSEYIRDAQSTNVWVCSWQTWHVDMLNLGVFVRK